MPWLRSAVRFCLHRIIRTRHQFPLLSCPHALMRLKPFLLICRKFHSRRTSMALFTQVHNPLTGKSEWAVQGDDYDYHMELSCTGFGDMLHDRERNQKYYAALRKAIANMHASGREVHVLDIGTGTGILAMMAAAAGADTVTACEAFLPMAHCAERILAANGMTEKVQLVKKRSTDLRVGVDMARKANLLVAEVLDTELIGEGAIGIYNHAHSTLLTDDVVCIPAKATCYAQVVQSPLAAQWNTMKLVANLDGEVLLKPPKTVLECKGEAAVHDVQLSQLSMEQFRPLSKPLEIFEFDFNRKAARETQRQRILQVNALCAGATDLVFYWWDIKMDGAGEILLSCAPHWAHPDCRQSTDVIPWRDHWMQAIYYIPKPLHLSRAGESFQLNCQHDEYSLWFDTHSADAPLPAKPVPRHMCSCQLHISYPRTRIGQLNQAPRNKRYLNYLEEHIGKDAHVLCLGDGCLLGLATAKLGAASVLCHETQTFSRRFMESVAQHNQLENVQFVEQLDALPDAQLARLTHIFAEPYFLTSILPWDNLRFGTVLRSIWERLPPSVEISPHAARIFAVPVEFDDLHKIRTPVGKCEGFDLTLFDKMLEYSTANLPGGKVEAQPLWEYPCKALAHPQELLTINFQNFLTEQTTTGTISIAAAGTCNGIALWVDWSIDGDSGPKSTVTTGPTEAIVPGQHIKWDMFVRQGVQLFSRVSSVQSEQNTVSWSAAFKPNTDQLSFNFVVNV